MGSSRLTLVGSIVGVVGTALLLVESIRVIEFDAVLSMLNEVLMWVGLGLMALGGLLLVTGVMQEPRPASAPEPPPAF